MAIPDDGPILELVLQRVRLRATRRAAWLRKLWAEEGEPGGKTAVTHAEMDTHLAGLDAPGAEAEWLATEPSVADLNRQLAEVEGMLAEDGTSRLADLQRIFGLSPEEMDLFQACLAQALDPSLGRVYAYLQDHAGRGYVSDDLAARLFGHGRAGLWHGSLPLARWELVQEREVGPGEPAVLTCDPTVRDWLQGRAFLDPALVGLAEVRPPMEPLANWPVNESAEFVERLIGTEPGVRVRVQIVGPPGSGRRTLAATIAERLGLAVLAVDTDRLAAEEWPRVYLRAQRHAYLDGLAPAWSGEQALQQPWPQRVAAYPIQFLIRESIDTPKPQPGLIEHRIELKDLSLDERRRLWCRYIPSAVTWPADAFEGLVRRHRVTVGEIRDVARKAPTSAEQAAERVKEGGRERLGRLAQLMECPFTFDDLIVPERLREMLDDLVFEARERAAFWERPEARRLFPQGRGLLALFSGPSGTGKTMAAQVIAAELGLDLFRIDLAAVVSKYVGETSQNLERVLSRARHMDVVLLFDEADALFGKRTEIRDAHDRFANTDTNYLLQAIEDYDGVAILSTNRKDNVDTAFVRRIRYVVDFPKPDAEKRLDAWLRYVNELIEVNTLESPERIDQPLETTLEKLAKEVEVTGAQIKLAVLGGAFEVKRDRPNPLMRNLMFGLHRELVKEGKMLSEKERRKIDNRVVGKLRL